MKNKVSKIEEEDIKYYIEKKLNEIDDDIEVLEGTLEFKKAKKQANDALIERVINYFEDAIQKNTAKPIAYLKQLMSENQSLALYHNFEKLSKEDIQAIIKDKK